VRDYVHGKLIIPLGRRVKGSQVGKYYDFLLKTEKMDRNRILQNKTDWLRNLLRYTKNNVPHYANIFQTKEIDINGDPWKALSQIPVLTKKEIQRNQDMLVSRNPTIGVLIPNSTGGSTGEPLIFYTTRKQNDYTDANILRHYHWVGWNPGQKHAFLWGAERDHKIHTRIGKLNAWARRYIWLNSFQMSHARMMSYHDSLMKYRPRILIGYASALFMFARFLENNNLDIPPLLGIQSSAEKLYDWQREKIEDVFRTSVYDRYGCREVGNIAHECENHEGMHVSEEILHVEILDGDEPVNRNEEGDIVVTSLTNYGFPFIRYRIGDRAVLSDIDGVCSCGRTTQKITSVAGRSSDIFHFSNGLSVHGEFFTHLFYGLPSVKQFQVIQESVSYIEIFIVPTNTLKDVPIDRIRNEIFNWIGQSIEIRFISKDVIEPTKTGKHRFTISKVSSME
jgi:phenylacetate-CoA ligase